jgi:hypothetical protein
MDNVKYAWIIISIIAAILVAFFHKYDPVHPDYSKKGVLRLL